MVERQLAGISGRDRHQDGGAKTDKTDQAVARQ